MKVDLNNRQSDVQIEILPMIDVIFCILTFFILAAVGLTRQQVIDLALPSVDNSVPVSGDSRDRLYVSVDSAGQVYIDANAVPLSLLQDVLVQHKQIAPNGTIVLYASSSARYEDVIKVLDLLRSVGGDRVALATLPNDASLDPTQGSEPSFPGLGSGTGLPGQVTPPGTVPGTFPGAGEGVQITPVQPGGIPPLSPGSSVPAAPPLPGSSAPGSSAPGSSAPGAPSGSSSNDGASSGAVPTSPATP
ncbi:MAG: biopolymer transporter ExbD [Cyanobacteria bacterium J06631_12]